MKRAIPHIICCLTLLLSGAVHTDARQIRFDHTIYTIRNNGLPNFRYTYDDYLQYSPAAAMVLMKACGCESRSSWGRMLTSDAFSAAIMAAAVNGIKYTARRPRPDGSSDNSFPSGHTATAFMTATMLYKEYGWQNPLISIGGYTVAAVTGVSRILNNRHWMTDVAAGASIGIGAVHLGYYLSDLIFKEKGLSGSYSKPSFLYDTTVKHYTAELSFGQRFFIGNPDEDTPYRGGTASVSAEIPIIPNIGITARGSANSLIYKGSYPSHNNYGLSVGGYWNFLYTNRFEFQVHALAGGGVSS